MTQATTRLDDASAGSRQEMIIQSALASCMMFTDGMTEESYASWAKARLLAECLTDTECQLYSLLVLWAHQIRLPSYAEATELADRCGDVADGSGNRGAIATSNYMRGVTYHHIGKGMALACGEARQISSAQECFEEAMTYAGQQSALSFELRAGLELARLWIDRGQVRSAHDLIGAIYGRFTEGLAPPDLILARQILEQTNVRARQTGRRAAI